MSYPDLLMHAVDVSYVKTCMRYTCPSFACVTLGEGLVEDMHAKMCGLGCRLGGSINIHTHFHKGIHNIFTYIFKISSHISSQNLHKTLTYHGIFITIQNQSSRQW